MAYSQAHINRYLKRFKDCEASQSAILEFEKLLRVTGPLLWSDSLEDLFVEACRRHNFTKPFEGDGRKRTFRARLLPEEHPDHQDDIGYDNSPGEEQAFRRGYDQEFASARKMIEDGRSLKEIIEAGERVHHWRTLKVQIINTWPNPEGTIEQEQEPIESGVILSRRRSSLSLKLRYEILVRDGSRCQKCGIAVDDGAQMQIDHIIPVSKGGSDEPDNLQVLCFDCNQGKSDRLS